MIYIPTSSPEDWKALLADPEKQWRSGYSARELAECWQAANGFPASIQVVLAQAPNPALRSLELLLAFPEYKVELPGGGHPSQNDLFVLARAKDGGLVSIMVEGKVNEPFGNTLETWLANPSKGKQARLKFLCEKLGLAQEIPGALRYQLFHRVVSAILEAERFNARYAVMLVHSFSPVNAWFDDYTAFINLFGADIKPNELVELPVTRPIRVYSAWISDFSHQAPHEI